METNRTKPITAYSPQGLESLLGKLGQPAFRVKQLTKWLYEAGVTSYDEMTNLPAGLRADLAQQAPLFFPETVERRVSADGTRKYLFELVDGTRVEAVGIPSRDEDGTRLTVCFSTQVGCAMACSFCATGTEGLTRSLNPGEMVQQIIAVSKDFDCRVTNAVAMGQGEPFANTENVLAALAFLNSPNGCGIGARHITVSTCGLFDGIDRFADTPQQYTLAISLHAAQQKTRDFLMPRCTNQPLSALKDHVRAYVEKTGRRVTLEYLMIAGVNDGKADLRALIDFCDRLLCHVNLLPLNDVEGSPLRPTRHAVVDEWITAIRKHGTEATLRDSRGSDIDGACGQLKNSVGA